MERLLGVSWRRCCPLVGGEEAGVQLSTSHSSGLGVYPSGERWETLAKSKAFPERDPRFQQSFPNSFLQSLSSNSHP